MAKIGELLKGVIGVAPRAPDSAKGRIMMLSKVEEQAVDWVWYPYIPAQMVTNIVGDPEAGKGWVTCAIAAALSGGPALPGLEGAPPRRVLFLSAEDNPELVLVPRLRKQGANLAYIGAYTSVFNLTKPAGLEKLVELLREAKPAVVVIDPITSFMGDGDPNKTSVVNEMYSHLNEIAQRERVAMLLVRHRRKPADGDRKGRDPKFGGVGSIGFLGGARSELLVGLTADGEQAMAHEKNNVGKKGPTQRFRLDPDAGTLTWTGADPDLSGWDLVGKMKKRGAGRPRGGEMQERAAAFLRQYLANGPEPAMVVIQAAEADGISKSTLSLVRRGIVTAFRKEDRWWWTLAEASVRPGEQA